MSVCVGTLPSGTRGFDVDQRLTYTQALLFKAKGYKFVVRYVRRDIDYGIDLNAGELLDILKANLSIMLVQHVAPAGWGPTGFKGAAYGIIAATEAKKVGVPIGVTLWCDLEGVGSQAKDIDVIAFCVAWFKVVKSAGYEPGLYVGDSCGLSDTSLYFKLPFKRYWSAYNLNAEDYPAVRGVQLRQHEYPAEEDRVPGIDFKYDENIIQYDKFNDTPTLLIPNEAI